VASNADHVDRLFQGLHRAPSLLDRVKGRDPRRACLNELAESGDAAVAARLMPYFALEASLRSETAAAITALMRSAAPAQLASVDRQVRSGGRDDDFQQRWWTLDPGAVAALAKAAGANVAAIGLLSSHSGGFVREAAVRQLDGFTTGEEIRFLALRVNDWVAEVSAAAGKILGDRLVPSNRRAVLDALPFLAAMIGRQRRDHSRFMDALRDVLSGDKGSELAARLPGYDVRTRRLVLDLALPAVTPVSSPLIQAALVDGDGFIRRRAAQALGGADHRASAAGILERMLRDDPSPAVRKTALAAVADRIPEGLRVLFPGALLDRSRVVRALAQYLAPRLDPPANPRDIYLAALAGASARQHAAALAGLAETGSTPDAARVVPFLHAPAARMRRVALQAFAALDDARAVPAAMSSLADPMPSVVSTAVRILRTFSARVDFARVRKHLDAVADPRARVKLLGLLAEAPKWDALPFLLESLGDPHEQVRQRASRLLDSWVTVFNRSQVDPTPAQLARARELMPSAAPALSAKAAELLQFTLKSAAR
jgi:HEAT repeat protein